MTKFRCVQCREGMVRATTGPGRTTWIGNLRELPIPDDIATPVCDSCGAEYIGDEAVLVTEAARPLYEARLRELAAEAVDVLLRAGTRSGDLERLLGLSQGYLSRVRSGKAPSEGLALLLMLLAEKPRAHLAEARRLWARANGAGIRKKAKRAKGSRAVRAAA